MLGEDLSRSAWVCNLFLNFKLTITNECTCTLFPPCSEDSECTHYSQHVVYNWAIYKSITSMACKYLQRLTTCHALTQIVNKNWWYTFFSVLWTLTQHATVWSSSAISCNIHWDVLCRNWLQALYHYKDDRRGGNNDLGCPEQIFDSNNRSHCLTNYGEMQ